jgi:hypothetical protein
MEIELLPEINQGHGLEMNELEGFFIGVYKQLEGAADSAYKYAESGINSVVGIVYKVVYIAVLIIICATLLYVYTCLLGCRH